jgi:rubredoxin
MGRVRVATVASTPERGIEKPLVNPDFSSTWRRAVVAQTSPARSGFGQLFCDAYCSVMEDFVKRYMCLVCGLVYDEEQGWPDDDIAPGTKWEDVPMTWVCPECGAGKEDFEMVEI